MAGDRRGDPHLVEGPDIGVRAPAGAAERAAAIGLLGGRSNAGQRRMVSLSQLTDKIRRRGAQLTPGAVAAHAVGRRLAERALEQAERSITLRDIGNHLQQRLTSGFHLAGIDHETTVETIRRNGTLARLLYVRDPVAVIDGATRVVAALPPPGSRVDRRILAERALSHPHGLDEGSPAELLSRALVVAVGLAPSGARARDVWSSVGVDWDELGGGISSLGIHPEGWHLPTTAITTVPPIELVDCTWPPPPTPGSWVFVTENPSVLTAARGLAVTGATPRILCTSGTPSRLETEAIARLTAVGWNLAVRADFDEAGLRHVQALIQAAPTATPWRMSAEDYIAALGLHNRIPLAQSVQLDSPWDPSLAKAMQEIGSSAFEEALISTLIDDLRRGTPKDRGAEQRGTADHD
ncbi:MAG: DUF2399 domain-containing protein [Pseudonocardiaceae bacterium]